MHSNPCERRNGLDGREPLGKTFFRSSPAETSPSGPGKPGSAVQESEESSDKTRAAGWRQRFDAVYRLEDGEVLKRVPPPYIPERRDYCLTNVSSSAGLPALLSFLWDGTLKNWGAGNFGGDSFSVAGTLSLALQIGQRNVEGPSEILDAQVQGDWIVRTSSTPDQRLRAFTGILKREMGMNIRLDRQRVLRTVVVVKGNYRFVTDPDARWRPGSIHLYSDALDPADGQGGGTAKFTEFLDHLGNTVPVQFLNESDMSDDQKVEWTNHGSAHLLEDRSSPAWRAKLDQLLNHLHRQTGLDYSVADREVELWVFSKNP